MLRDCDYPEDIGTEEHVRRERDHERDDDVQQPRRDTGEGELREDVRVDGQQHVRREHDDREREDEEVTREVPELTLEVEGGEVLPSGGEDDEHPEERVEGLFDRVRELRAVERLDATGGVDVAGIRVVQPAQEDERGADRIGLDAPLDAYQLCLDLTDELPDVPSPGLA